MRTRPVGPWLRVDLLELMHSTETRHAENAFCPDGVGIPSLRLSGVLDDCGWDEPDVRLAFREMVAIGHATVNADGYRHYSTEAGRIWYQAERAAEQSRVDALESAAVRS